MACNYGLSFFLPTIVKDFGLTKPSQTGFVTALPYLVGTVGMVWWGRRSDRKQERKGHAAFALFLATVGLAVSTQLDDPVAKMVALSVAGFGIFACLPIIWTLPTAFLSGPAAAGESRWSIRSANLSGFLGPYAVGRIKDATGSYTGGLLTLAVCGAVAMAIVLAFRHNAALEKAPPAQILPAE